MFIIVVKINAQQWELLPSINDTATNNYRMYRAINFISKDTGFLALTAERPAFFVLGCIYKTENGGQAWRKVTTQDVTIRAISISGNMGYAVGVGENELYYSGQILISTNRGENWSRCTTFSAAQAFSNVIQVNGVVYVSCYDGKIYFSSNNGASWGVSYNPSIYFASFGTTLDSTLYLGSDVDLRKKSLNGSWQYISNHGIMASQ